MTASVTVLADVPALAAAVAHHLATDIRNVLGERSGDYVLALSGGRTPVHVFEALRVIEADGPGLPWDRVVLLWVDERAVPADHADSNFGSARRHLLAHIPAPAAVLPMVGEDGAVRGAEAYAGQLRRRWPDRELPPIDCAVLGIGEDGHVASLFPGDGDRRLASAAVCATTRVVGGHPRISLTQAALDGARSRVVMASGAGKRPVVRACLGLAPAQAEYPAAALKAAETFWFVTPETLSDA
ncbi:6-phosphogluconolactonase [Xanthobacter agilis]|uniref:6-phosphogluconolactonase n=1 Tax=Xanthobacter agilis TaxID=47492 RepID=UPI00372BABDA